MLGAMQSSLLRLTLCSIALLIVACSEPEPPPAPSPSPSAEPAVEAPVAEEAPPAEPTLPCVGLELVDHPSGRIPALLLEALGDDTADVRLEIFSDNTRSIYVSRPETTERSLLSWSIDRAHGPGHWSLEPSREHMLAFAPDAEPETDTRGYGRVMRIDLGERAAGHLHFEQIHRNFGADTASLHCVAPTDERWELTLGHARALGMFPARVPAEALDALTADQPVEAFNAGARVTTITFARGRTLEATAFEAALREAGFARPAVDPERAEVQAIVNDMAVVLSAPSRLRVEILRSGRSLTFSAPTVGDTLHYGPAPDAASVSADPPAE